MAQDLDKRVKNVVQLLRAGSLTVSTAESCTGGLLSEKITAVAGSSEVFGFGVCSYANEAKMKLIGVKAETLDNFGAVSRETAEEMANGIRKVSGADFGVSTTGIAGPSGGDEKNPVGTVWIGISSEKGTYAEKFLFDGTMFPSSADKREAIRLSAAFTAFEMLEKEIKGR